jgi:hypothetical protein
MQEQLSFGIYLEKYNTQHPNTSPAAGDGIAQL